MSFVVRRGEICSARLVIPKKLRPILGKSEFKKSLGTASRKEAELLAAPLILQWKKLIEGCCQTNANSSLFGQSGSSVIL